MKKTIVIAVTFLVLDAYFLSQGVMAAHEQIGTSPSAHYVSYQGDTLLLIGDSGTQCAAQNSNLNHRAWIDDCHARGIRALHLWSFVPALKLKNAGDTWSLMSCLGRARHQALWPTIRGINGIFRSLTRASLEIPRITGPGCETYALMPRPRQYWWVLPCLRAGPSTTMPGSSIP